MSIQYNNNWRLSVAAINTHLSRLRSAVGTPDPMCEKVVVAYLYQAVYSTESWLSSMHWFPLP